jgi:hypothetical protein
MIIHLPNLIIQRLPYTKVRPTYAMQITNKDEIYKKIVKNNTTTIRIKVKDLINIEARPIHTI